MKRLLINFQTFIFLCFRQLFFIASSLCNLLVRQIVKRLQPSILKLPGNFKLSLQHKFLPGWSPVYKPVIMLFAEGLIMSLSSPAFSQVSAGNKDEAPPMTLKVQQVVTLLQGPTAMTFPGNGDIWVTEQPGKIRVIKNGKLTAEPLIDLKSKMIKVNSSYEERGLLGITLHPQFKSNKKFYVFYSAPSNEKKDHKEVVAEYKLPANGGPVNPNSGRVILTLEDLEGNHNGGCLEFGPDGYLYLSFGDGGGQGDKHGEFGNGQKMNTWFGKILRIDVNTTSGYKVPKDNPFVGRKNVKPEIWAYGFRNPYRFSFDKVSKQLFAGDVGQDLWEEIDIIKKGANYGWRLMEGNHFYNPADGSSTKGLTMPITEYNHREGISVIAGYIYNGKQVPAFKSKYLFADWTGRVFYLQKAGPKWLRGKMTLQNLPENLKITAFGEDTLGELYVLTNKDTDPENTNGGLYKIGKN